MSLTFIVPPSLLQHELTKKETTGSLGDGSKKENTALYGHGMAMGNLASLVHSPVQLTPTSAWTSPQPTEAETQHSPYSSTSLSPCKAHMGYLGLCASICAQPSLYFATQGVQACVTVRKRP